jgi:hypothetical protein
MKGLEKTYKSLGDLIADCRDAKLEISGFEMPDGLPVTCFIPTQTLDGKLVIIVSDGPVSKKAVR